MVVEDSPSFSAASRSSRMLIRSLIGVLFRHRRSSRASCKVEAYVAVVVANEPPTEDLAVLEPAAVEVLGAVVPRDLRDAVLPEPSSHQRRDGRLLARWP